LFIFNNSIAKKHENMKERSKIYSSMILSASI